MNSLLIVAAVLLVSSAYGDYVEPDKFVKNYAKINKYLEKNLANSDEPEANLVKANELLEQKAQSKSCKLFGCGLSMIETIKLLNNFAEGASVCKNLNGRQYANNIDEALDEVSRLKKPNDPLTRVDKIIEHYASKTAQKCGAGNDYQLRRHGHKQESYERINELLVEKLPENDGVDSNMMTIESLLSSSAAAPPDGALALALKQVWGLKSILSMGCNEQSYHILLANDLGTKLKIHYHYDAAPKRLDKMFKYYALKHEEMCRREGRNKFLELLKQLDEETYRRVLGLAVVKFVKINQFKELAESLDRKPVDGRFSVPLMDEVAKATASTSSDPMVHLEERYEPELSVLYYFAQAMAANDPDGKLLQASGDVSSQIDKFILAPCAKFLQVFRGPIDADDFSANMDRDHTASPRADFLRDITYHMVREANKVCKHVEVNQDALFKQANYLSQPGK